jgi:uncharacterized Tic20 family protein
MTSALALLLAKTAAEEGRDIVLSMLVVGLLLVFVILLGDLYNWRARKRHSASGH